MTIRRCDTEATFFVNVPAARATTTARAAGPTSGSRGRSASATRTRSVRARPSGTRSCPHGPDRTITPIDVGQRRRTAVQHAVQSRSTATTYNGNNAVTWTITTRTGMAARAPRRPRASPRSGSAEMAAVSSILPKIARVRREHGGGRRRRSGRRRRCMQDRGAVTAQPSEAPEYVLAGADTPAGPGPGRRRSTRSRPPASEARRPVPTLSPEDLNAAAARAARRRPAGRRPPPSSTTRPASRGSSRSPSSTAARSRGRNCTLASGAMLARLAFGIVTSGIGAADAPGRPGRRDRAQRPRHGPVARLRRHLSRPACSARSSSRTCSRAGYGAVIQGIYGEIPGPDPPPEELHRRPRDLPRRLLPGQPRAGDPGGLLRDRPARPAARGLPGRLVAGVDRRRLRRRVRRRADRGDVGVPARRGAARGRGPGRPADPAGRRRANDVTPEPTPGRPRPRPPRRRPRCRRRRPGAHGRPDQPRGRPGRAHLRVRARRA